MASAIGNRFENAASNSLRQLTKIPGAIVSNSGGYAVPTATVVGGMLAYNKGVDIAVRAYGGESFGWFNPATSGTDKAVVIAGGSLLAAGGAVVALKGGIDFASTLGDDLTKR